MSFVPRTNFDGVLILDSFESDNNSHGVLYVFAPTCLDAAPEVKWESKDKTHKQVVDIYNKTGGAIFLMAKYYGLPLETVLAVFAVEAGNCGSHVDGRVTIRVEARPPVLSAVRWCKDIAIRKSREKEFRTKYGAGQPGEWNALKVWWAKSGVRALNYTSFGLSQVLGSNYSLLGYKSPVEMFNNFQDNIIVQIAGFFAFVENAQRGKALQHMKAKDFVSFAGIYNGPGQKVVYGGDQ